MPGDLEEEPQPRSQSASSTSARMSESSTVPETEDVSMGDAACGMEENASICSWPQPDQVRDQLVIILPLLAAASARYMEATTEELLSLPLLCGSEDWRSLIIADVCLAVMKLAMSRKVLSTETIPLRLLLPGLKLEEAAKQLIKVPQGNFAVLIFKQKLQLEDLCAIAGHPPRKFWAYAGPGNQGSDSYSYLLLENPAGRQISIQIQSKVRSQEEAMNSEALQKEVKNLHQLSEPDMTLKLIVTEQHFPDKGLSPLDISRVQATVIGNIQRHAA